MKKDLNPATRVTEQELNFLKSERWVNEEGDLSKGDYKLKSNPTMARTLKMSLDGINKNAGAVMFLRGHIDKRKKEQMQKMAGFVWSEDEVINKKVFPVDYSQNLFYFGLLLPKNVDYEVKGKKIGKKQIYSPCLITSDKKVLEVDERLKEDYGIDFDNIPSGLPKRWNLEHIRAWLNFSDDEIKPNELLNKIVRQYEKYLSIRNKTWYKIHSLWDLGTYFYQLFEAYPFLELRGIAGTGKTKSMVISSYLSFNGGQIMVNPSEATLFRETDEVRGTKYFDEAEKLWVYNKSTKQYEGDVRTELINASYTKDAKVPRQEKIFNKFVTKWYSPYSPTQLSSVNGLYGATETRAITRITTKSSNEDCRGELEPAEDRAEIVWENIRDSCYRFALTNWKEIKELYNNFPKNIGLKRRDYQIWKPILTLAKFISEDLFNEVVEFAQEMTTRRINDLVPESSFDYMCLEALKNCVESLEDSTKIYIDRIKFFYCKEKGIPIKNEYGKEDFYLNRNISHHLDNLGFKDFRRRDKTASFFGVDINIFNEIVSPICPNLVALSTSSTLSTPLHINNNKKGGDGVVMGVDKEKEKVVMVAIDGDDVDDREEEQPKFTQEEIKKSGIDPTLIKEISGQQND